MNIIIIFFTIISLIHFIFKNYVIDQNGEIDIRKQLGFTSLRFGILMSLIIFIINVVTIGNKCDNNNLIAYHAFISFLPWVIVYGIFYTIFLYFPGWKAPFSNTFGYLFVRFLKANTLIINLFNTLVFNKEDVNDKDTKKLSFIEKKTLMNNIYKDQSIMLNVITINNINSMWESLFSSVEGAQEYKQKLYDIVIIKDKVSEFIWYVLLSTIAYTISNRYMSTIVCEKSSEDLEETADNINTLITESN
uniref:Uncharacterized protein n=1 Tax=viral metagenome TaxID=1070528 RepID=A0A6C0BU80_9ZZZZ